MTTTDPSTQDELTLLAHADRMEAAKIEAKFHAEQLSHKILKQEQTRVGIVPNAIVAYTTGGSQAVGRVLLVRSDNLVIQQWRKRDEKKTLGPTTVIECVSWTCVHGMLRAGIDVQTVAQSATYDPIACKEFSDKRSPFSPDKPSALEEYCRAIAESKSLVKLMTGTLHHLRGADINHCVDLVSACGLVSVDQLFALLNGPRDDCVYLMPALDFKSKALAADVPMFSTCVYSKCPKKTQALGAFLVMNTPGDKAAPPMQRICAGICEDCVFWTHQVFGRALSLELAQQFLFKSHAGIHPYRTSVVILKY